MRKPIEVEITVSDIQNCPDTPPKRTFWDFLPVRFVGFLRRFFPIPATPLETWAIMRAYKILIDVYNRTQAEVASAYTEQMLDEAKAPKDPWEWN